MLAHMDKGHTLAFAMYINNLPGTRLSVSGRYRWLIDSLCSYLLKQNPSNGQWAKIFSPHKRMQFQQNLTQAQVQRAHQARWRALETVVKKALQGQSVTVLYRGQELVLKDHQADANRVWLALQNVRKKYPFAVALAAKSLPIVANGKPLLLWMQENEAKEGSQRVWTIREAAS